MTCLYCGRCIKPSQDYGKTNGGRAFHDRLSCLVIRDSLLGGVLPLRKAASARSGAAQYITTGGTTAQPASAGSTPVGLD